MNRTKRRVPFVVGAIPLIIGLVLIKAFESFLLELIGLFLILLAFVAFWKRISAPGREIRKLTGKDPFTDGEPFTDDSGSDFRKRI
jgi:hypothetical protein